MDTIRIFIGSGEASRLERKTLVHSIRSNTKAPVDIRVFNGTHNAIESDCGAPVPAPMSLRIKYTNTITEFSQYRYLIPELCGHQGKAIWLDSDMICLGDISELYNTPMNGCDFLALSSAYESTERGPLWGTSVLLIDCERCRFDLDGIFDGINSGVYDYFDFTRMSPAFLQRWPYKIGPIDPRWNSFDYADDQTRLIHYTKLETQPWKFAGHPYGDLWFQWFERARAAGYISDEEVGLMQMRGYVRQDLHMKNSAFKSVLWHIKKIVRDRRTPVAKRFAGAFGGRR